jgi:Leucine-rich repeat (LRR) protein
LELKNLTFLDISYNNLSLNENPINVQPSSITKIGTLRLASCNLKVFPSSLINQSTLRRLDLSNNQIQGVLPNWIWKINCLDRLNISHNFLTELEGPLTNLSSSTIDTVDLHNNLLQGPIPVFLKYAFYLDYRWTNLALLSHKILVIMDLLQLFSLFHSIICMEVSLIPYAMRQIFNCLIYP